MSSIARKGLWGLVVGLTAANAVLALTHIDVTTSSAPATPDLSVPASWTKVEPAAAGIPLDDLSEAVSRPAFWSSRRPRPVASEPVASATVPVSSRVNPDELKLTGVMRLNARKRALIAWQERPEGVWLDEGATHAGWRIASIGEGEVQLEADGDVHRLQLRAP